jgi:hypothetical protein
METSIFVENLKSTVIFFYINISEFLLLFLQRKNYNTIFNNLFSETPRSGRHIRPLYLP